MNELIISLVTQTISAVSFLAFDNFLCDKFVEDLLQLAYKLDVVSDCSLAGEKIFLGENDN